MNIYSAVRYTMIIYRVGLAEIYIYSAVRYTI
jgi:hypothetical protein